MKSLKAQSGLTKEEDVKREQERIENTRSLTLLSANSHLIVAERSGHEIHLDQPELAANAIRAVVEAAKNGFALRPIASSRKTSSQGLGTKSENPLNVRTHQPAMNQKIERHGVANMVARQRAAVARFKRVLVNPLPVRAADLFVHWRYLPAFLGCPCNATQHPRKHDLVQRPNTMPNRHAHPPKFGVSAEVIAKRLLVEKLWLER